MAAPKALAAWRDQLAQLLDEVLELTTALGVVHSSGDLQAPSAPANDRQVRGMLAKIQDEVRRANTAAGHLLADDPGLADVVHPLLSVPGEEPAVDLRPRWSRVLDFLSRTAKRATLAQALETLRLEADAAILRATGRLARLAR
jgi:hypothetical protein